LDLFLSALPPDVGAAEFFLEVQIPDQFQVSRENRPQIGSDPATDWPFLDIKWIKAESLINECCLRRKPVATS